VCWGGRRFSVFRWRGSECELLDVWDESLLVDYDIMKGVGLDVLVQA
jgi:hypothetical protein